MSSVKPILYLSGPIAGIDDFEQRFEKAEAFLAEAGYPIINPCKVPPIVMGSRFTHEQAWIQYMRGDIAAMMRAGGVALLSGHEKSSGSHLEKRIAFELGIPIMTVEQWERLA